MKRINLIASALMAAVAVVGMQAQSQAVTVTVDGSAAWEGFMNVSELPANGGGFVFGSGWGVPDLVADIDAVNNTITTSPNTVGDPNEFWYQPGRPGDDPMDPNDNGGPGALGNKSMEANLFVNEVGTFAGQTLTFTGTIDAFSLTGAHVAEVFIKDFEPDFSSAVETSATISSTGTFSITQSLINDPARPVQYGFRMTGENVWVTDVAPFGSVTFGAIPEPTSLVLFGLGVAGLAVGRRRK